MTFLQGSGMMSYMAIPLRYTLAIGISYATGFIGSLFIRSESLTWYEMLLKPPFTPSAPFIMVAWLILYGLIGIALGVLWAHSELWNPWVGNFLVGLAFNAAWVMFFFGFRVIFIALVDLVCLLIITLSLVLAAWDIERRAAILMMPYLAWIIFALYLNAGIWLLS